MAETYQDRIPSNLSLHVGEAEALLERANSGTDRSELILAPVELHRRNVQRRLRETETPKDAFVFADPVEAGRRVLETANAPTNAIDRIDRLSALQSVVSRDDAVAAAIDRPAGDDASTTRTLEQIRTEIETVTNFHPARVAAFRTTAGDLSTPIDTDAAELLDAAIELERALRRYTSEAVSEVELVRRATRRIAMTDGEAWRQAYATIERVSLVGVSNVAAPHADVLHALLAATAVDVHIYFRRGTGAFLAQRVPDLLDVAEPGTVVFE